MLRVIGTALLLALLAYSAKAGGMCTTYCTGPADSRICTTSCY